MGDVTSLDTVTFDGNSDEGLDVSPSSNETSDDKMNRDHLPGRASAVSRRSKRQFRTSKRDRKRSAKSHITVANNILPPCRVCGGTASGFHYGVNTCEACKRFFRRSLDRKRLLKCRDSKTCHHRNLLLCAYCRYQRCLAVGMSKTAIKTGRYSHEQRADNLLQVKRHEQSQAAFLLNADEVDRTMEALSASFTLMMTNVDVPPEEIERALREKVEAVQAGSEMFGRSQILTEEQYLEVYQSTGLDVDGRRQHGAFMATSVEYFLVRFIKFAKDLPTFRRLCLTDQTSLIKECWLHVWFLAAYRGFNIELQAFYPPNKRCRTKAELLRTLGKEWMDHCFCLAWRLQGLSLSREDVILLCAITLMSADRCDLQESSRVEEAQWFYVRCLLHLLRRRHAAAANVVFARISSCLVELRTVSDVIRKTLMSGQLSDIIQTHPVLMDVL